jgi:hypothetical protein
MAATSRFSISGTISMFDKSMKGFGSATKNAKAFSGTFEKQLNRANRASLGFGNVVKGVLGASIIQGAIYRLKDLALNAIQLASDLTEVQNVVDVTFGKMSGEIDKFATTALEKFGLSELQAKQFAGTIGAMVKSSGIAGTELLKMSKDLTGLAGDFASFYNLPHDVAFQKIRAGISGETEPLKALGINMSVANMSAFAMSKGITKSWKAMTQAEQTMLRYNFLMEKSADAQGDFNRTLDTSFANQQRVAKTRFDEILAKAATQVLPMLTEGFKELNNALKQVDPVALGNGIKSVVEALIFTGKAIVFLMPLIKTMIVAWIAYRVVLTAIAVQQKAMIAIGWIKYLQMMWPVIMTAVAGHWLHVKALVAEKAILLKNMAAWVFAKGVMIASAVATKIVTAATWLFNAALLANPIVWVVIAIIALIAAIVFLVKNWETVKAVMLDVWDVMKNKIANVILFVKGIFYDFVFGFTYAWFVIIDAVLAGVEKIGSVLGLNVDKISQMRQEASDLQASIKAKGNVSSQFASPESRNIVNTNNNTTTTNGRVDINVNAPKTTTTEQSGTLPQGMVLNTGAG